MAKLVGRVSATIKKSGSRKPTKPGRVVPKNVGGIANAKVIAIVKKYKNG